MTNEVFTAFDPARRLDATRVAKQFMVMNELEPAMREWRRQCQGQAEGKAGQP